jgi:hypothetical protein
VNLGDYAKVNTATGGVRCGCLRPMRPEVMVEIPSGVAWLWWRCPHGHVTKANPLPRELLPGEWPQEQAAEA